MNDALEFDHVGIVAGEIDAAAGTLAGIIPIAAWTRRFDDPGLGVSVRFGRDASGVVYELIAPLGEASPVARTVRSKTNLLNQIAYRTTSIKDSAARLRAAGSVPLGAARPALAFGGAPVQFMLTPLGFVLELIEAPGHRHAFDIARLDTAG